jgi:hypothetical protein
MTRIFKSLTVLGLAGMFAVSAFAAQKKYLVTNDDNSTANTATFYSIGADGELTQVKVVKTGGTGNGGGYFAAPRVGVLHDKVQSCVYVSDAGSADVAAISEATLKLVGRFKAGTKDAGTFDGIGLIANQDYLYAGFSGTTNEQGTGSIATYKILSGCKLKYLKSIPAKGLAQALLALARPTVWACMAKSWLSLTEMVPSNRLTSPKECLFQMATSRTPPANRIATTRQA